jgi:glc operon protein GlcG
MNRVGLSVGVFCFAALFVAGGTGLAASAPAAAPVSKLPPPSVSLAEASVIVDAAIAFARERNLAMAVIVVDANGNPVASERMDGVSAANLHFAEGKAFAAAMLRQTTESLSELAATRPDRFFGMLAMYPGKMYFDNGGVPLIADGILVGAIGVSGLPRKQDEPAGRAGIAAWERIRARQ